MIFILYKINADVGGHYNDTYIVDSHCESITQDIVDSYPLYTTNISSIKLNDLMGNFRWAEHSTKSNSIYDCVIFFNDKGNYHRDYNYDNYNSSLEKTITEYK